MKLPSWEKSKENIELGIATPLENFIYDHEPVEKKDALLWRNQLAAALECRPDTEPEFVDINTVDDAQLPLFNDPEVE